MPSAKPGALPLEEAADVSKEGEPSSAALTDAGPSDEVQVGLAEPFLASKGSSMETNRSANHQTLQAGCLHHEIVGYAGYPMVFGDPGFVF